MNTVLKFCIDAFWAFSYLLCIKLIHPMHSDRNESLGWQRGLYMYVLKYTCFCIWLAVREKIQFRICEIAQFG